MITLACVSLLVSTIFLAMSVVYNNVKHTALDASYIVIGALFASVVGMSESVTSDSDAWAPAATERSRSRTPLESTFASVAVGISESMTTDSLEAIEVAALVAEPEPETVEIANSIGTSQPDLDPDTQPLLQQVPRRNWRLVDTTLKFALSSNARLEREQAVGPPSSLPLKYRIALPDRVYPEPSRRGSQTSKNQVKAGHDDGPTPGLPSLALRIGGPPGWHPAHYILSSRSPDPSPAQQDPTMSRVTARHLKGNGRRSRGWDDPVAKAAKRREAEAAAAAALEAESAAAESKVDSESSYTGTGLAGLERRLGRRQLNKGDRRFGAFSSAITEAVSQRQLRERV